MAGKSFSYTAPFFMQRISIIGILILSIVWECLCYTPVRDLSILAELCDQPTGAEEGSLTAHTKSFPCLFAPTLTNIWSESGQIQDLTL